MEAATLTAAVDISLVINNWIRCGIIKLGGET